MAEDVEELVVALNLVVCTVKQSNNMRGTLKQQIFETVSTLRTLFAKIKDSGNRKTSEIEKLTTQVEVMETELKLCRDKIAKGQPPPSLGEAQELQRSKDNRQGTPSPGISTEPTRSVASPTVNHTELSGEPTWNGSNRKLYASVVAAAAEPKHKAMIKSKTNQTSEMIKNHLKSKINPTEIKVGITSLRMLRDGRLMIEASSKQEIEALGSKIEETCGTELEVSILKCRNPTLLGTPEEINTENVVSTLARQNPELGIKEGDIRAKFCYTSKRGT
jgi:predicted  nucleic acid-binding Zn-ribbon protein